MGVWVNLWSLVKNLRRKPPPLPVLVPMGDPVYRVSMRCKACGYWWSVHPSDEKSEACPCGGELARVDVEAEHAKLPRVPFKPEEPTKL